MNREYIKRAALMNILFNHRTADRTLSGQKLADFGRENFVQGAEWRINSTWHETEKETPQAYGEYANQRYPQIPCLVIDKDNIISIRYWNTVEQAWEDFDGDDYSKDKEYAIRWSYLGDLLPERKEEKK